MKLNQTYLIIAISSVALFIVLAIQVNWIVQTAKIKEAQFNEKANMVLARTSEAISADPETCRNIDACIGDDSTIPSTAKLGKDEVHKIDSIFNYYMKFYNFHIDYSFSVVKPTSYLSNDASGLSKYIYNKPLDNVISKNGWELKLIFPERKQFIMAELGTLFITSVILILIVLILFWRTMSSLLKEKNISEHTNDFLNNMTHEFKTPLTNIALAGKMIIKDFSINNEEKIKHYSEIILEENEKLRLQVEQVLSMTALERGEIPLQKKELDFHQLISASLKYISIQLENKQGKLNLELNAVNFNVVGDKTHLTNALCNLIDNSIKYSGEKPELSIKTTNVGKNLIVSISDNGIGIEKEHHKKVFDKFYRVPTGDMHNVKGFGLGLAYIKKIVELHGGLILLQSEKGKGTTITISLPNA